MKTRIRHEQHAFPALLEGTPSGGSVRGNNTSLQQEGDEYTAAVQGGYRHRRETVAIDAPIVEAAQEMIDEIDGLVELSITEGGEIMEAAWSDTQPEWARPNKAHHTRNLTPLSEAVSGTPLTT